MQTRFNSFNKIRPLALCSLLSILAHLLLVSSLRMFGSYDFAAAVKPPAVVMVDLVAAATVSSTPGSALPERKEPAAEEPSDIPLPARETISSVTAGSDAGTEPEEEPAANPVARTEDDRNAAANPAPVVKQGSLAPIAAPAPTMLKTVSEALSGKYEKLSYLVSLHGLPIGSAELESKYENGVTAITLRMKTNAAISNFYPVDDEIQTRHIDGRFIMTSIRQQEGSFKSSESFTINVRKKSVSWVDFSNPRSAKLSVPTGDVLDTLSGIYYLRNRPLQVGRTETLHIFDSETYAKVPVEILRREEMRLPNLTTVATVVVRPLQNTAGIFRRTGELLIWMTDDDFKVPVKIVTSMALGQVTAELISSESKPYTVEGKDRRAQNLMSPADPVQQQDAGATGRKNPAALRRHL